MPHVLQIRWSSAVDQESLYRGAFLFHNDLNESVVFTLQPKVQVKGAHAHAHGTSEQF
jgi:hypothetical protein